MRRSRSLSGCVIVIVILSGIILLVKMDFLPSLRNIFLPKPVTIDDTRILIKDIRSLGEIITATLYDEVVVDSTIIHNFPQLPVVDDRIVIIARGKVLAGVDLTLLTDSSVTIANDTVWMQLPPTKIIDVIINPADYETFEEQGNWKPEAVTAVKMKARAKITNSAFSKNIIITANTKARSVLEDFLHAAGFKAVYFTRKL